MATFIFMLTRETQDRLAFLVLERLTEKFPQHEFIAGSADHPEFENTILPAHGEPGPGPSKALLTARLEVLAVKEAFQRLLADLRDWKPS